MNLKFVAGAPEDIAVDTLVLFAFAYDTIREKNLRQLNSITDGALDTLLASGEFTGKAGQHVSLYSPAGFAAGRILLVGMGDKKSVSADCFRKAIGAISRRSSMKAISTAAISLGEMAEGDCVQAMMEGLLLGSFEVQDYKSALPESMKSHLKSLTFVTRTKAQLKKVEKAVTRGQIIAEGQILARRLAATPANDLTPRKYATEATRLARKYKFSCRVLELREMTQEKMNGVLCVSRGSEEPPRFLILSHKGGGKQKPIVLVGKGVD